MHNLSIHYSALETLLPLHAFNKKQSVVTETWKEMFTIPDFKSSQFEIQLEINDFMNLLIVYLQKNYGKEGVPQDKI